MSAFGANEHRGTAVEAGFRPAGPRPRAGNQRAARGHSARAADETVPRDTAFAWYGR